MRAIVPLKLRKKNLREPSCELTITDGQLTLNIPGAEFLLPCITTGTAKASLPFNYLYEIVSCEKNSELKFELKPDSLRLNTLEIKVSTCFIEDDKILRSLDLPVNYNDGDLLKLLDGRYTSEELNFNQISDKILEAKNRLDLNILSAQNILKVYGVSRKDLEELISSKLNLAHGLAALR